MLLEQLKTLERTLHGSRRNDREWLEQILHDQFREMTRSGVLIDRSQTIEALSAETVIPTILSSDFQLIQIREMSRYCTTGHSMQAALARLCVLRVGSGPGAGNGNWYSIRGHLKRRADKVRGAHRRKRFLDLKWGELSQPTGDLKCQHYSTLIVSLWGRLSLLANLAALMSVRFVPEAGVVIKGRGLNARSFSSSYSSSTTSNSSVISSISSEKYPSRVKNR